MSTKLFHSETTDTGHHRRTGTTILCVRTNGSNERRDRGALDLMTIVEQTLQQYARGEQRQERKET